MHPLLLSSSVTERVGQLRRQAATGALGRRRWRRVVGRALIRLGGRLTGVPCGLAVPPLGGAGA